jgi:hypothetical protein
MTLDPHIICVLAFLCLCPVCVQIMTHLATISKINRRLDQLACRTVCNI